VIDRENDVDLVYLHFDALSEEGGEAGEFNGKIADASVK
jgi:hypothetical protein